MKVSDLGGSRELLVQIAHSAICLSDFEDNYLILSVSLSCLSYINGKTGLHTFKPFKERLL